MKAVHRLIPVLLLLASPAVLLAQKPLGDSFRVNPSRQIFGGLPHVAANPSGEFVVTWIGFTPGDQLYTLYSRRFAADGRPATGAIRVENHVLGYYWMRAQISVAMNADGSFVVVFPKGADPDSVALVARRFSPGGAREAEVVVAPKAGNIVSAAALGDGGVAVAWQDPDPQNIRVRSFGPGLAPRGPVFKVAPYASLPVVAASLGDPGGSFVLAWQGYDMNSQSLFIAARTFAADGSPGRRIRVADPSYHDASLVYAGMDGDGNFLIAWAENSGRVADPVFARRFRADGTPVGGVLPLDLGENGYLPSSLAMGERGNFVLTWEVPGVGDGNAVFARRFAADGVPLGPVIPVAPKAPGHRISEQAAIGVDGGFVVVWSSNEADDEQVYARRFRRR